MREGFRQLLLAIALTGASLLAQAQSYITDKVVVGVYEQPFDGSTLLKVIPTGTPLEILERRDAFSQVRTPDDTTGWVENTYIIDSKPEQLVVLELTDKQQQTQRALDDAHKQLLDMQEQLAALQDKAAGNRQAGNAALKKQQQANTALQQQLKELRTKLGAAEKKLADTTAQRDKLDEEAVALREMQQQAAAQQQEVVQVQAAPTSEVAANTTLAELQTSNAALQKKLDAVYAALALEAPSATTLSGNEAKQGVNLGTGWLLGGIMVLLLAGFVTGMKTLDWLYLKRHGGFRL